jgi:uncharacterized protein YjdB
MKEVGMGIRAHICLAATTSGLLLSRRPALASRILILAVLTYGCGGSDAQRSPTAPPGVASVAVSVDDSTLAIGRSVTATATLRDARGTVLTGHAVTWGSSDLSVATVSSTGVITGIFLGTATIYATSGGQSGSTRVSVIPASVASVQVTLGEGEVVIGRTTQATAALRDAQNNALAGRVVSWGSSDLTIATVNPAGLVTAIAPGTVTIYATSEGQSGSTTLTVITAAVASVQVSLIESAVQITRQTTATATFRDAQSNVITGRQVTWTSSAPALATVSAAGVVTAVAPGNVTISASSGGKTGAASLTITPSDGPIGVVPYLGNSAAAFPVSFRYKVRLNRNTATGPIKVLFMARSFFNPSRTEPAGLYQIETNLYSYWLRYTDTSCLGWPPRSPTNEVWHGQGGLWISVPDYSATDPNFPPNLRGRIGVRPSDPVMFPRQNAGIDNIPNLSKIETMAQQNMTGIDIAMEISRGTTFTDDLSNWGYRFHPLHSENAPELCVGDLPRGFEYRRWHVTATFGGKKYESIFALPEQQASHIAPNRMLDMVTEFFESAGDFQAYLWDFAYQEEAAAVWRPITKFTVNYQNFPSRNLGSGVKVGVYQGTPVLEFSNDRTDTYAKLGDILTISAPASSSQSRSRH